MVWKMQLLVTFMNERDCSVEKAMRRSFAERKLSSWRIMKKVWYFHSLSYEDARKKD